MYRLPQSVLRWAPRKLDGRGQDATNSPVSSFDAVDTILVQLADRKLFPNLKTVRRCGTFRRRPGGAAICCSGARG